MNQAQAGFSQHRWVDRRFIAGHAQWIQFSEQSGLPCPQNGGEATSAGIFGSADACEGFIHAMWEIRDLPAWRQAG